MIISINIYYIQKKKEKVQKIKNIIIKKRRRNQSEKSKQNLLNIYERSE